MLDQSQDVEHRRPYESLLLCWPAGLPPPGLSAAGGMPGHSSSGSAPPGFHLLPGRPLVVAAVPPAAHSRKPHLGALLLPLLPPGARCLEVRLAGRGGGSIAFSDSFISARSGWALQTT